MVVCINIFHHPKFHAKISLPTPLLESYFYVFILNDKFLCDKYAHRFLIFHHLIYFKKLLAQVQANQISSKFTRIIPFVTIHFKNIIKFCKTTFVITIFEDPNVLSLCFKIIQNHMVNKSGCAYGQVRFL